MYPPPPNQRRALQGPKDPSRALHSREPEAVPLSFHVSERPGGLCRRPEGPGHLPCGDMSSEAGGSQAASTGQLGADGGQDKNTGRSETDTGLESWAPGRQASEGTLGTPPVPSDGLSTL